MTRSATRIPSSQRRGNKHYTRPLKAHKAQNSTINIDTIHIDTTNLLRDTDNDNNGINININMPKPTSNANASKRSRHKSQPISPTGQPRSPGRNPVGTTGLLQARALVQSILDQVTYNDSPPMAMELPASLSGGNPAAAVGPGAANTPLSQGRKSPRRSPLRRKKNAQAVAQAQAQAAANLNAASSASASVGNSTITSQSGTMSMGSLSTGYHTNTGHNTIASHSHSFSSNGSGMSGYSNSGMPRTYSRQHHILPTIYSPGVNHNNPNNSTGDSSGRINNVHAPSVSIPSPSTGDANNRYGGVLVQPSPLEAEMGDVHATLPFLPSPSFANSAIGIDPSSGSSSIGLSLTDSTLGSHKGEPRRPDKFHFENTHTHTHTHTENNGTGAGTDSQLPPLSIITPAHANSNSKMPPPPPIPPTHTQNHPHTHTPQSTRSVRPGHGAEVAMGNLSLAALCVRTIDSVSDDVFRQCQIPKRITTNNNNANNNAAVNTNNVNANAVREMKHLGQQKQESLNADKDLNIRDKVTNSNANVNAKTSSVSNMDMYMDIGVGLSYSKSQEESISSVDRDVDLTNLNSGSNLNNTWENEVERAPTFGTDDGKPKGDGEDTDTNNGSIRRSDFLQSLHDDQVTDKKHYVRNSSAYLDDSDMDNDESDNDTGNEDMLFPEAKDSVELDDELIINGEKEGHPEGIVEDVNNINRSMEEPDIDNSDIDTDLNIIPEHDEEEEDDDDHLDIQMMPSTTSTLDEGNMLSSIAESGVEDESDEVDVNVNVNHHHLNVNTNTNAAEIQMQMPSSTLPSPHFSDIGDIPMVSMPNTAMGMSAGASAGLQQSASLSPQSLSPSALSPNSLANTKLTMSPDRPPPVPRSTTSGTGTTTPGPGTAGAVSPVASRRIQMFGSEYARHLQSESPFSPVVTKASKGRFGKFKKKRQISGGGGGGTHRGAGANAPSMNNSAPMNGMNNKVDAGGGSPSSYSVGSSHMSMRSHTTGQESNYIPPHNMHIPLNSKSGQSVSSMNTGSAASNAPSLNHHSHSQSRSSILSLEDASTEILTAAITDIVVTHGEDPIPKGYFRISQTSNGTDLETLKSMTHQPGVGFGKKRLGSVWLNVKKEPNWDRAVQRPCVTALTVIFPDRNEFVPPGFCVVRRYKSKASKGKGKDAKNKAEKNKDKKDKKAEKAEEKKKKNANKGGNSSGQGGGRQAPQNTTTAEKKSTTPPKDGDMAISASSSSYPANLNYGTPGERVYICYRRSREGNPITGLIPLQPSNYEAVPEGYTVLERTPRNYVADVNSKAGPPIFLAFRQRLANLETLRPLPLVMSVHYSNSYAGNTSNKRGRKRSLRAYYCTGGTVVPSDIGRFHIMDRSTHPLISPSSVTNRLSLIHAARIKNNPVPVNPPPPVVEEKKEKKLDSSGAGSINMQYSNDTTTQDGTVNSTHNHDQNNDDMSRVDSDNVSIDKPVPQPQAPPSAAPKGESNDSSFMDGLLSLVGIQKQPERKSLYVGEMDNLSRSSKDGLGNGTGASGASTVDGAERRSSDHLGEDGDHEHSTIGGSIGYGHGGSTLNDDASISSSRSESGMSISSSAKGSLFGGYNNGNGTHTSQNHNLQQCFNAMNFIPIVECPAYSKHNVDGDINDNIDPSILLEARIAVITPILTACYTHHGGSSLLAVEGLVKLLQTTDFFLPDVACHEDPHSHTRLTLLDLSIQVVCDAANSTARETNFLPCIEFVAEATYYSRGILNARTIGYVMRFYLFVFYFGASIPTASSWPKNRISGYGYSRKEMLDESNDVQLLSEDELKEGPDGRKRRGYVPGGAPQAAALALKEFITLFLGRLRKMKSWGRCDIPNGCHASMSTSTSTTDFLNDYVHGLVDGAIHQVDVSNYTQLALHQIHRSGGSELFWHDMMTSCGVGLFGGDADATTIPAAKEYYICTFSILASMVKITSGKVRRLSQSSEFVPRDAASKLFSLELMHHLVHQWGKTAKYIHNKQTKAGKQNGSNSTTEESPSVVTMAYTVRRLIVTCLLSNTRAGLDDIRVFRRMMRIVTELWTNTLLRRHIKIELGVLIEHFCLKLLRLGPQVLPPKRLCNTTSTTLNDMSVSLLPQQVCIVTEMKTWFQSEPRDIIELFMNFDQVDAHSFPNNQSTTGRTRGRGRGIGGRGGGNFSLLPSTHWKITQQLCGAICTLAEQCTDIVSDQIRLTRIDLAEVDSASMAGNAGSGNANNTATANGQVYHNEGDVREMTLVRNGSRYLQEKCFETMGQIMRSLMLCAAASSGANYNLLVKLKEKQVQDEALKNAQSAHDRLKSGSLGRGGHDGSGSTCSKDNDDSSMDSDGNMTVKSVSTLGNIVGGIMNTKKDVFHKTNNGGGGIKVPESPRHPRTIPNLSINDSEGDIVEYWQTSIAAERRKNQLPGPHAAGNSDTIRRPPRAGRGMRSSGTAGAGVSVGTPPRKITTTNGPGAVPRLSPRKGYDRDHNYNRNDDASIISYAEESLRGDPHLSQKFEENLHTAFEIMQTKSLKKSLEYLVACNILTSSPRDIASFLRLYQARIGSAVVGDFLGEGGKDGDEVEHYNLIRFYYISAVSFVGMNVEQGLRHFLTNCGFRLPGEAQKIDRVMTMFSQCYWEDNAGDHGRCPFHDQDTVFLISFAIIMLNTDLHKSSNFAMAPGYIAPKQKQRKKMTKTEFLNNLRGVDNSEDLSRDYLSQIYDSIANNPIAIYSPPENSSLAGISGRKTIKFSSGEFGHIIQGNIDLAAMIKHVIKSVKPCQELLRGLASHEHPYLTIKNTHRNKKKTRKHLVPEDLVRSAFSSLWHHFHGTVNSALDSAHLDPKGLENCLDVLMYTLCTTICLDLTVERNAFASQLVRVKFFRENRGLEEDESSKASRQGGSRRRDHLDFKNDPWYMRIEKAAESYNDNAKIAALDEVDVMFKKLHTSLKMDSTLKKEMILVAKRIRNGEILLNDPTRYFVKEGELFKRCNRSGRTIKYMFFLFSDVLIYAHKSGDKYKIHGELPLHLMKIMDLNSERTSRQKKSFHLIHPRKSFIVYALDVDDKTTWLATINAAIGREVKRKARIEGARQNSAAYDR
uniref:Uncharacterized protein n=1 Tax=Chaetoceros debilis TaxID=122233 RepID=A0A7S3VDI2_9STRA